MKVTVSLIRRSDRALRFEDNMIYQVRGKPMMVQRLHYPPAGILVHCAIKTHSLFLND